MTLTDYTLALNSSSAMCRRSNGTGSEIGASDYILLALLGLALLRRALR